MKLKIVWVLYVIILIPIIKPVGLAYNSSINTLLRYWKLFSIFLMCGFIVKDFYKLKRLTSRKYSIRKGIIGLLCFELIYLINSIMRSAEFLDLLNNSLTCLLLLVLVYLGSMSKRKNTLFSSIDFVFTIYIICQIISMALERINIVLFRVEDGGATYFFGPDNYSAFTIIPMIGVLMFIGSSELKKVRFGKKNLCLLTLLALCYIWTGSVTAALSLIILLTVSLLAENKKGIIKFFSAKWLLLFFALALILILSANIQNYFSGLLRLVGKGERGFSLNSRTYIWGATIRLIKESPIIGIGNLTKSEVSNYILYGTEHAHNIILELLLRTGIIGFISYLYYLLFPAIKYRRLFFKSKNIILLLTIFVYLVLSFMDFYPLLQAPVILVAIMYACVDGEISNSMIKARS